MARKKIHGLSKYKPEYCEKLIEHMESGYSYQSFAGVVRVNKDTLYEWEKTHPEFSEAKNIGVELGRIFWEKLGIEHILSTSKPRLGSKSINATVWIFNMKNRFGWKGNSDNATTVNISLKEKMEKARKRKK